MRKTWDTRAEAEAWRPDTMTALSERRISLTRTTVGNFGDGIIEAALNGAGLARGRAPFSPSTAKSYEGCWLLYVRPRFVSTKLIELDSTLINKMVDELDRSGLSANTIANALLPLRLIAREAKRAGLINVDPFVGVEAPRRRSAEIKIVPPEKVGPMLAKLSGEARVTYAIATFAGLRIGEIAGLRWSDIDFDRKTIQVRRTWLYKTLTMKETPKTKSGRRDVPIVAPLAGILIAHRRDQKPPVASRLLLDRRGVGTPLSYWTIRKDVKTALDGDPLAEVSPHECRHTFASFMIASGVNLKALSVAMGHSSVAFTLDKYGHLLPDARDEMLKRFEAWLSRFKSR